MSAITVCLTVHLNVLPWKIKTSPLSNSNYIAGEATDKATADKNENQRMLISEIALLH